MSIDRFWILIARELSGEASVEEIRELQELLRLHPNLYFSVEIITNLWKQRPVAPEEELADSYAAHIERMKTMGILFPQEDSKEESDMPYLLEGARVNRSLRILAIAVTILLVVTAGFFLQINSKTKSAAVDDNAGLAVTTKYGSRTNMQLPDGSKVWLNAGSTITYDKQFGKVIREVVLSGEAFFDVVRNTGKPFIIHTTSMDIKVLGTKFNVKAYANDKLSEASLIHGSIEVSLKKRGAEKILLKPNEKIVVMNELVANDSTSILSKDDRSKPIVAVQKLTYVPKDSTIIETSWVDNKLIFRNESFGDIAVLMERWYGIPLKFQDASLNNLRFTGTFTNETIEQALEAMQITAGFRYTIRNNSIIITK